MVALVGGGVHTLDIERRRKNPRLPTFDYRVPGPYFITICALNRSCLFGQIAGGGMRPNPAGAMVCGAWEDIPLTWPEVALDAFILMPNHVHGIVFLDPATVDHNARLGDIIGWFKTVTTNRYIHGVRGSGWSPFDGHVWQRNYYEHVVRDDADLDRIRTYIAHNPALWAEDRFHVEAG